MAEKICQKFAKNLLKFLSPQDKVSTTVDSSLMWTLLAQPIGVHCIPKGIITFEDATHTISHNRLLDTIYAVNVYQFVAHFGCDEQICIHTQFVSQ